MQQKKYIVGTYQKQPGGYQAFIPASFPLKNGIEIPEQTQQLHSLAMLALGKLDGITQLLPDIAFFLFMYVRKEATLSSQIEGTRATLVDSIAAESLEEEKLPHDVNDILHYIRALNEGLKRLEDFPLSLRFLREIHRTLMSGARSSHFADPGEFRTSQNWIGGTTPASASFVPPSPHAMHDALDDFEKFLHNTDYLLPLVKTALIHSQFETIHPFLDGNGRTGRLLITFYLCQQKLLERPVLYLSAYFKQHQQLYYELLYGYHHGQILPWINFVLEGITTVANDAVSVSKRITSLREKDLIKVHGFGKTASQVSVEVLKKLYQLPIVNVGTIQQWTGYTRAGAQNVINRLVDVDILQQKEKQVEYGRKYVYKKYLDIFQE